MSCVAELNDSSQKNASVNWKKCGAGIVSATPAMPAPSSSCSAQIHCRRVFKRSTSGLHNGLMTHGRYSQPV